MDEISEVSRICLDRHGCTEIIRLLWAQRPNSSSDTSALRIGGCVFGGFGYLGTQSLLA